MRHDSSHAGFIDLGHALRAGWVEFAFQPKVELKGRTVTGVEMFARAQHPFHGTLPAGVLVSGADAQCLAALTRYAINTALQASQRLSRQGFPLPVTINVPVEALHDLPAELILDGQSRGEDWPGLIFDIGEEDILADIAALSRIADELTACRMKLAADGFGRSLCSLIQSGNVANIQGQVEELSKRIIKLKTISVFELKLDRSLIAGCATDRGRASLCKVVIDLIHHVGSTAVAVGVETAMDAAALREMGCDIGQGHYFGRPMSLDAFMALMKSSAAKQKARAAGAR